MPLSQVFGAGACACAQPSSCPGSPKCPLGSLGFSSLCYRRRTSDPVCSSPRLRGIHAVLFHSDYQFFWPRPDLGFVLLSQAPWRALTKIFFSVFHKPGVCFARVSVDLSRFNLPVFCFLRFRFHFLVLPPRVLKRSSPTPSSAVFHVAVLPPRSCEMYRSPPGLSMTA